VARTRGLAALALAAGVVLAAAPARAQPDGDRIDQTMERSLDQVYQREMPLGRGDYNGAWIGGGGGGGGAGGGGPIGGGGGGGGGSAGSAGGGGVPVGGGSGSGAVPGPTTPEAGSAGSAGGGSAAYNPDDHDGSARRPNGTPSDPRRRTARSSRGGGGGGGGASDDGGLGSFGGIAKIMLWGLIAVIVVMIVVFVIRQASGMTGEDEPIATGGDDAADDPNKIRAVVERPRDDADQLAFEGRYAEAIHTLLLRTVHELASQNLVRVTPSMTSREVLAKVPMLGDARAALADLVTAVEVTWFGDDVPGEADYARCRAHFELFAAAYRRGAAHAPGAPGAPAVLQPRAGQGAA
jgi:hypothetical protein